MPNGGTGNFPAHPKIIKIFLEKSNLSKDANIIDIGSGSGMVLFVAYKSGYNNLAGIEFSNEVYLKSLRNLDKNINLINGDALELNISKYDAMFFFSPFRGDLAVSFFKKIPSNIKLIIAVNYDKKIEPVLRSYGFLDVFSYKHFFYKNFNGKVFKR